MEKWDILDADGKPTGETVVRGVDKIKKGQYHKVVHIWVVDDKGRVLIQQRSMQVEILPGKWAITGGSAVSGEDELTAAVRELSEEVGITAKADELKLFKTYRGRNDFVYVYLLYKSIDTKDMAMQPEEVQAVKWVTAAELRKMVSGGEFHRYYYLSELLRQISN